MRTAYYFLGPNKDDVFFALFCYALKPLVKKKAHQDYFQSHQNKNIIILRQEKVTYFSVLLINSFIME